MKSDWSLCTALQAIWRDRRFPVINFLCSQIGALSFGNEMKVFHLTPLSPNIWPSVERSVKVVTYRLCGLVRLGVAQPAEEGQGWQPVVAE